MERYEAYKDSGVEWIGEIPAGWDVHPLGAHSTMVVPMRDKPTRFDGDIPWVRIEDFDGKYISASKSRQNVSECLINDMNLKVYPVGTVLCSCSCNLGVCAIVEKPLCSNQTFIGCVPSARELDSGFLFYLMSSMSRRLNYLSSGTIQTYLSRHDFKHLSVQIPPFTEQRAIAEYLDIKTAEIDGLVADCEREVELLQEYRKAVISEAVTKGLDPNVPMKDSGVEWIGEIPDGWDAVRLDKVAIRKSGHTPDKKVPEYWDGDIVWISLADSPRLRANAYVSESTTMTTEAGIANSSAELLPKGAVLLSRDASVGLTAISGVQLAVSQHFMAYICDANLSNEYLRYVFLAMHQEFEKLSMGSTIPTIGLPLMRKLTVPYPSRKAQDDIVGYLNAKVTEIDVLIDDNQSMADKLREYRRSLISEAVTGKFKVPGVM